MFSPFFSLRKKILLPFFLLMVGLSVILLACMLFFVSDLQQKDYLSILRTDAHVLDRWLIRKKDKQLELTNSLPQFQRWALNRRIKKNTQDSEILVFTDVEKINENYKSRNIFQNSNIFLKNSKNFPN